jgi:hypothetical protein
VEPKTKPMMVMVMVTMTTMVTMMTMIAEHGCTWGLSRGISKKGKKERILRSEKDGSLLHMYIC